MRTVRPVDAFLLAGILVGCSSSSNGSSPGSGSHDSGAPAKGDSGHGTKTDSGTTMTNGDSSTSGGNDAGSSHDATTPAKDGAVATDGGLILPDAGAAPLRMLVTLSTGSSSQVVAVNIANKAIDGRLAFNDWGITDTSNASAPWLCEQSLDQVALLDPVKPWNILSYWNVDLADQLDGGQDPSTPSAVVVDAPNKAYVLRYDRNEVAIINQSQVTEAGAPTSTINLSALVQPGGDGFVEPVAGMYMASDHRAYVLLANINQTLISNDQVTCDGEVSTLTAIDTTNDTIVDLGGSGPKGSVVLNYYNPVIMQYDATGNQFFIVSQGCFNKTGTGDAGADVAQKRGIESVNLSTMKATSMLDISAMSFPAGFVPVPTDFAYINSTSAIIGFDSTGDAVYNWDPQKMPPKLGTVVKNAPDTWLYDGKGNLVGTKAVGNALDVVQVQITTGTSTTIASNISTLNGTTYVSNVAFWPKP